MSSDTEEAEAKIVYMRGSVMAARRRLHDEAFMRRMGNNYNAFVHWLEIVEKNLDAFAYQIDGWHAAPSGAVVANTGPAILELEGPAGLVAGLIIGALSMKSSPGLSDSAKAAEARLDWSLQQLRDLLPPEEAQKFVVKLWDDYRVWTGVAVYDAEQRLRQKAKMQVLQQALDDLKTSARQAVEQINQNMFFESLMTAAKQLTNILGIDKRFVSTNAAVVAISSAIRDLENQFGKPPRCAQLRLEYQKMVGAANMRRTPEMFS